MWYRSIPSVLPIISFLFALAGLSSAFASSVAESAAPHILLDSGKCENLQRLERRVSGDAHSHGSVDEDALNPGAKEKIYSEHYYVSMPGKQRQVLYRYPDQRIFFSKILDYSASDIEPDYIQADWRNMKVDLRLTRGDEVFSGSIPVSGLIAPETGNDSSNPFQVNEKTLIDAVCNNASVSIDILATLDQEDAESTEPGRSLVIDAGFDDYVRENWPTLMKGDSLRFAFLPAGRSRPVAMRIKRVGLVDCQDRFGDSLVAGTSECLELRPNAFFARALINPIYLQYTSKNQRLVGYHGLTNIKSDKGKPQSLRIVYRYYE